MFKYVHHVDYIVRDLDAMVEYLAQNFGLKPVHRGEGPRHGKEAVYEIGKTLIEIRQPLDPTSEMGKHLAEHGPGVYHVAWAVDDIRKVGKQLEDGGNKMRHKGGVAEGPHGYLLANIDPASSHGVWFQLAEGERRRDDKAVT